MILLSILFLNLDSTDTATTKPPEIFAPLPVLSGDPNPWQDAPPAVRFAAILNIVGYWTLLPTMLVLMVASVPLSDWVGNEVLFWVMSLLAVAAVFLGIPANFLALSFHRSGRPLGWRLQTMLSLAGLLFFPMRTILNAALLRQWFRRETKAWYEQEMSGMLP